MKKTIEFIATFAILLSFACLPAHAAYSSNSFSESIDTLSSEDTPEITVSEPMTLQEALAYFNRNSDTPSFSCIQHSPARGHHLLALKNNTYRVFTASLNVKDEYHPYLEFLCETSEGGHFFNINNIYSVQLVRQNSVGAPFSRQFSGTVDVWLRGVHSIEYAINGDFYYNGTTTVSGGTNLSIGDGMVAQISFNASAANTSNHYAYFYENKTVTYGR